MRALISAFAASLLISCSTPKTQVVTPSREEGWINYGNILSIMNDWDLFANNRKNLLELPELLKGAQAIECVKIECANHQASLTRIKLSAADAQKIASFMEGMCYIPEAHVEGFYQGCYLVFEKDKNRYHIPLAVLGDERTKEQPYLYRIKDFKKLKKVVEGLF